MLYTPLLPEAAAATLEPRHVVVPLRQMCPHAELLLGRVTALDRDAQRRDARRRSRARSRSATRRLVVALGAVVRTSRCPACRSTAMGFKDLADAIALRNRVLQPARARDRSTRRSGGARLRLRRRRVRGRRGARRAERLCARGAALLPRPRRSPAALGARRRRAEDPPRDTAPARRVRGASTSSGAVSRSTSATTLESYDGREAVLADGYRIPARTLVWTAGVQGESAARPARPPARRARPHRCRRDLARRGLGQRLGARRRRGCRQHEDAGRHRPADLPARAPPGAPPREEPPRIAEAVRLPDARPGGDARPLQGNRRAPLRHPAARVSSAGSSPGRTTSTSSRSSRGSSGSSTDWTVSLFFRRDIVELSVLGHPHKLGE